MSTTTAAQGPALPLAGVRVVEFTHMVMGPTCGMVLADLGAEVIKVEPVGGDNTRRLLGSGAGFFALFNRNKKSLAVDVKDVRGREIVLKLVAGAEVLDHHVRRGGEPAGEFEPLRVLEVQAHALLVAVVHREVTGARAEQLARGVAADRLDLDHLRTELDEDGAHRGPHHHVGELDDAQARERGRVAGSGHAVSAHVATSRRVAGRKPSGRPASGVNP